MNWYRKKVRNSVLLRDRCRCFYCGIRVRLVVCEPGEQFPPDMATLDHIVPKSAGGGYNVHNLVTACYACNNSREIRPADEFLAERIGAVA